MNALRYAELASKVIVTTRRGHGPPPSLDARSAAVAAIERALREKRERARRRRVTFFAASAAAAVFVTVGAVQLLGSSGSSVPTTPAVAVVPQHAPQASAARPTVTMVAHPSGVGAMVRSEGHTSPMVDGARLAKGSQLVAGREGGVSLSLSTGTKVTLLDGASLRIDADGPAQLFSLTDGTVRAEVAKLAKDERFVVRTSDTEVEVRGTVFQVTDGKASAAACGDTATRVVVTEGVVVVRHHGTESRIAAGQRWPAQCEPASVPAGTAVLPMPNAPHAANENAPAHAHAHRDVAPTSAQGRANDVVPTNEVNEPSRLAEQNDLFERGLSARRSGAHAEAVRGFETLIRRYPKGPLSENAAVERMRALRSVDKARAGAAAREYLSRYPSGFARTEATSVVEAETQR